MPVHTAYIGIGSNLGETVTHVRDALDHLRQVHRTRLDAESSLYQTAPIDADGGDYINAVVRVVTQLPPPALLHALQQIETRLGRDRPYPRAPRTLDLDILLYDRIRVTSGALQIPHPRMTQRAFVLVPLLEIAPDIDIPGKGLASQYLAVVKDQPIHKRISPQMGGPDRQRIMNFLAGSQV
ncbi:MAG: 2-amino-4-hydroxy-6-hydroxymethyldihydropteridine diphosphokinase [Burkholderiaceae bacterium]|jgi:2-amino-4-hydroxy-6-hydroxymethyldihydropteridine diphosphokinase|nr:2-amino-4-hydroxy-6-hydroxymethyldihydropteridine diphosphokinase [Burkholderiaceae bacterium]